MFVNMFFQLLKCFLTDIMLDLACILRRRIGRYANAHKPICHQPMALIDALRNRKTGFCQLDKAVRIDSDIAVTAQKAHCAADTWLGKLHMLCNINGTHSTAFIF